MPRPDPEVLRFAELPLQFLAERCLHEERALELTAQVVHYAYPGGAGRARARPVPAVVTVAERRRPMAEAPDLLQVRAHAFLTEQMTDAELRGVTRLQQDGLPRARLLQHAARRSALSAADYVLQRFSESRALPEPFLLGFLGGLGFFPACRLDEVPKGTLYSNVHRVWKNYLGLKEWLERDEPL